METFEEIYDYSKESLSDIFDESWVERSVFITAFLIIICPIIWSIVILAESKYLVFSEVLGSNVRAFVLFTVSFITLSLYRDWSYLEVLESQSHSDVLAYFAWLGYFLVVLGGFLNMAIIGLIGIKGAYFGYFFGMGYPTYPFEHAISVGTVLLYLGLALVKASQAGLILTILLALGYMMYFRYDTEAQRGFFRPSMTS